MIHNTNQQELENFMYNITWLRKHYGLSKKKMAELLGIGLWSLNQIEQGRMPPRLGVDILFALRRNFGLRISVLLAKRLDTETDQSCLD